MLLQTACSRYTSRTTWLPVPTAAARSRNRTSDVSTDVLTRSTAKHNSQDIGLSSSRASPCLCLAVHAAQRWVSFMMASAGKRPLERNLPMEASKTPVGKANQAAPRQQRHHPTQFYERLGEYRPSQAAPGGQGSAATRANPNSTTPALHSFVLLQLSSPSGLSVSLYGGLLLLLAAAELVFIVRNTVMSGTSSSPSGQPLSTTRLVSLIGLAGGVYDNTLVAMGSTIGVGPLLETLSLVRYMLHGLLVPFLLIPAAQLAGRRWMKICAFVGAPLLALYELSAFIRGLPIAWEPRLLAGTLRLANPDFSFPIITVGVNLVLLAVAILIRKERKDNTLLIGSLAALLGNALPIGQVGTFPGALGEGLLYASILMAARNLVHGARGAEGGTSGK